MARKQYNPEEIDEAYLISTIQNSQQTTEQKPEKATSKVKAKKTEVSIGYLPVFIRQTDSKARFGKHVPIRQEYHERIQKIVRVIGNDEISIFDYIDNLLNQHFEDFQEEIVKLYNEKNKTPKQFDMAEIILITAISVLTILLLKGWRKTRTACVERENTREKNILEGIVGKSTFVLTAGKSSVSETDSSGKMDIEVPLEYEPDISVIEEQEDMEQLGLPAESFSDLTFEEMMEVVNEVGNAIPQNPAKAGKLLHENDNADWVEQMVFSSPAYQKRIVKLIDLHLGKLGQFEVKQVSSGDLEGFDIGAYL
jgi:hypothetical protein